MFSSLHNSRHDSLIGLLELHHQMISFTPEMKMGIHSSEDRSSLRMVVETGTSFPLQRRYYVMTSELERILPLERRSPTCDFVCNPDTRCSLPLRPRPPLEAASSDSSNSTSWTPRHVHNSTASQPQRRWFLARPCTVYNFVQRISFLRHHDGFASCAPQRA